MPTQAASHNGRNRLLALVAPEDQAFLQPLLGEISLEVGAVLQEAGFPVEYIYFRTGE